MAVNYSSGAKTARMQAVLDLINAGSGTPKLKIRDASNNILVTIPMDSTSAGTVGGDPAAITFDCTPALSAAASAGSPTTATNAIMTDVADATIVSGLTVGVGTGNIQLDAVSITAGQTVTITAGTITHAADT